MEKVARDAIISLESMAAPYVTLSMINAEISQSIVSYMRLPNTTTTICHVKLANGATLLGTSRCMSRKNYDRTAEECAALGKAKDKLWELMEYAMLDDAYNEALRNEALRNDMMLNSAHNDAMLPS